MEMRFTEQLTSQIRKAGTPEEAYRRFCSLASEGIGNIIADAVRKAVSDARTIRTDVPWQEFLGNHLGVTFAWNTPATSPGESFRNVLCRGTQQPQTQTHGDPTAQNVEISVGVGIRF